MCAGTKFEVLWLSSNAENVTTTNPQAMHGERRSHKRLYFVKIIDLRRRRRDRVCATPKYICQAGPIVPPCARSICDIVTRVVKGRDRRTNLLPPYAKELRRGMKGSWSSHTT